MDFIKKLLNLFKEKRDDRKSKYNTEFQKNEDFNESLIDDLKNDHKTLFKIYSEIKELYENNPSNYKDISEKLHDFKLTLEVHLMVEDSQLYTYLEKKYSDNKTYEKFIKDVEHEMATIAKEVLNFIRKYNDYQMYQKYNNDFLNELENIGNVLTKRVELEEKRLYSLYKP
ncbi:hemerythrin domain-containing protein [Nitrosophilus labii]|uniref:hemerythrin domain-containing protein n=1 Tax=Nitrosophilus labii TaxID=2706014 RepID=UPI0016569F2B|nr:hemerythrin domain-containing protein [Nitrosophilus labii]